MIDDQLRALVRDAVARHLGAAGTSEPSDGSVVTPPPEPHPSHAVYVTVVNGGDACVIEPGVPCNHCNYCKSHGY